MPRSADPLFLVNRSIIARSDTHFVLRVRMKAEHWILTFRAHHILQGVIDALKHEREAVNEPSDAETKELKAHITRLDMELAQKLHVEEALVRQVEVAKAAHKPRDIEIKELKSRAALLETELGLAQENEDKLKHALTKLMRLR